jgi:predicted nucleic acid-binding protein
VRVIDSSSLVKFFSKEEGWEKVTQIIEEGVITLDLSIKEIANALWKKIIIGEMNEDLAIKILYDLLKGEAIIIVNQDEYLIEAFKIANRNKITIYDSLFIALAKSKNLELVTSDKKQYEIAKNEGVNALLV